MPRVLYVSLEFVEPIFSGNGVLSRSHVRGLLACGWHVCVLTGGDANGHGSCDAAVRTGADGDVLEATHKLSGHIVPLSVWRRTDRAAAYREFEAGSRVLRQQIVDTFAPDVVVAVDWTGHLATRALALASSVPVVFANYCVYALAAGCSDNDRAFYVEHETAAMRSARLVLPLCPADAQSLCRLAHIDYPQPNIIPLLPPLRRDIATVAQSMLIGDDDDDDTTRQYLTCCVRLHPQKQSDVFVRLIEDLVARGAFDALGVTPLLCGAAADAAYAESMRTRLAAVCPNARIIRDFLTPEALAQVLRQTLLNIHPNSYEAYGMTMVEAAACGAPTLVDASGQIGGAELLRPAHDEIFARAYESPEAIANAVTALLADRKELRRVARKAQARALSYSEDDVGRKLSEHLFSVL